MSIPNESDGEARRRERRRESHRRWDAAHRTEKSAWNRAWRERNPERVRQVNQEWRRDHLERSRELNRVSARRVEQKKRSAERRRARERGYYEAHAEERRAYTRAYLARRYAEDPEGFAEHRRAAQRAWYHRHKERLSAAQAERYRRDPATKRDYARDYYERHKEEIKGKRRAHYAANKERISTRHKQWLATQRRREKAGLPARNLHRTPRMERDANQTAAAVFFSRMFTREEREGLLDEVRTPPEWLAAWERDCRRARAALYLATTPEAAPRTLNRRDAENARLDAIARRINDLLRTQTPRPSSPPDPAAPHHLPATTHQGMSR